jgi:hypothetical protein
MGSPSEGANPGWSRDKAEGDRDKVSPDARQAGDVSESTEAYVAEPEARPSACPKCGQPTPAAFKRSDGVTSFRCDRCGHEWVAAERANRGDDLPPVASIDAPGG